jgi:hypothetical protein
VDSAISLWNYVVLKWISPQDFVKKFGSLRNLVVETYNCLVVNFERLCGIASDSSEDSTVGFLRPSTSDASAISTSVRMSKKYLYLAKDILIYFLKVLWVFGEHKVVVNLGIKIISVYIHRLHDVIKDVGVHCFPLMINSQRKIVDDANAEKTLSESNLNAFVQAWKDEQARKVFKIIMLS